MKRDVIGCFCLLPAVLALIVGVVLGIIYKPWDVLALVTSAFLMLLGVLGVSMMSKRENRPW